VASNGHGSAFAVRFEAISSDGLRSLSSAVSFELKHRLGAASTTALVVDRSKTVSRFVRASLDELGAETHTAGTVLDAIHAVIHGGPEMVTVFVGNPAGSSSALGFAHFLRGPSLSVRVVLLVDDDAFREVTPSDRRQSSPVAALERPWTPTRLAYFLLPVIEAYEEKTLPA
jgi:hypothetical protein